MFAVYSLIKYYNCSYLDYNICNYIWLLWQHCPSLNKIYNYIYNHHQPYIYFISIYGIYILKCVPKRSYNLVDTKTDYVFAVMLGFDLTIGLPKDVCLLKHMFTSS